MSCGGLRYAQIQKEDLLFSERGRALREVVGKGTKISSSTWQRNRRSL